MKWLLTLISILLIWSLFQCSSENELFTQDVNPISNFESDANSAMETIVLSDESSTPSSNNFSESLKGLGTTAKEAIKTNKVADVIIYTATVLNSSDVSSQGGERGNSLPPGTAE